MRERADLEAAWMSRERVLKHTIATLSGQRRQLRRGPKAFPRGKGGVETRSVRFDMSSGTEQPRAVADGRQAEDTTRGEEG